MFVEEVLEILQLSRASRVAHAPICVEFSVDYELTQYIITLLPKVVAHGSILS